LFRVIEAEMDVEALGEPCLVVVQVVAGLPIDTEGYIYVNSVKV
jgi:hypothetical protein